MKYPMTSAIRQLRAARVDFEPFLYRYEARGGTAVSARELGVSENCIVKTLVMEDHAKQPLLVLMDGEHEVSTKTLARLIDAKTITPCDPATAQKHTGYQVGGTSPFGTRKSMPVYLEQRILAHDAVYINGGKRGFLVRLDPREIQRVLSPIEVECGIEK